jgi:hypothetical protein
MDSNTTLLTGGAFGSDQQWMSYALNKGHGLRVFSYTGFKSIHEKDEKKNLLNIIYTDLFASDKLNEAYSFIE